MTNGSGVHWQRSGDTFSPQNLSVGFCCVVVLCCVFCVVLCWSPLFGWETEAGEGVALPGRERTAGGCWGCSPAQPPPALISLSLLADETVTLEITEPITHGWLEFIHILGAFFLLSKMWGLGFSWTFQELWNPAVGCSCRDEIWLFEGLAGRLWLSLYAHICKSSMLCLQFACVIQYSCFGRYFPEDIIYLTSQHKCFLIIWGFFSPSLLEQNERRAKIQNKIFS